MVWPGILRYFGVSKFNSRPSQYKIGYFRAPEKLWEKMQKKNISMKTPNPEAFYPSRSELGARSFWSSPFNSVQGVEVNRRKQRSLPTTQWPMELFTGWPKICRNPRISEKFRQKQFFFHGWWLLMFWESGHTDFSSQWQHPYVKLRSTTPLKSTRISWIMR